MLPIINPKSLNSSKKIMYLCAVFTPELCPEVCFI